jgi:hypothetical protein
MSSSRRTCPRCGVRFPPEADHPDVGPGDGVARDATNSNGIRFFTPEQLGNLSAPYALCRAEDQ